LKDSTVSSLLRALLLFALAPSLRAQTCLPHPNRRLRGGATPGAQRDLSGLLGDRLEHDPELARHRDKRYNDRITDYSVKAVNARLEREQNFCCACSLSTPPD